jgi:hypothetical protein
MLPIVSRLIQARGVSTTDPQAPWHSSQSRNTVKVGIAAPAAADGPAPQRNDFSIASMGQVRVGSFAGNNGQSASSYLVPPVGMDASKRGTMLGATATDPTNESVQARAALAEEAIRGGQAGDGKCAIM